MVNAENTTLSGLEVEYKSDGNLMISKPNKINFCLSGKKAELTIYNAGTENITLGLQIRTAGWSTIGGNNEWNTIAPGKAKTIITEISEEQVASGNFALLVANGGGKTGKIVICNLTNEKATELATASSWNVNNSVVPKVVENPESALPPVLDPNVLHGIEIDYTSNSSTMIANLGALDFVRDGDTATLAIYNSGTESITVELTIRKKDSTWSKVAGAEEWHTIPAGTGKTITITSSAADTLSDNFVVLTTEEAGEKGKIVICNLTAQQAINLYDETKWCLTTGTAPKVVTNPEFTEPSPSTSPETSPAPTPSTPDLKAEGGYITVTKRANQNSGPIQYIGDALKASGDGTYYLSTWVKIPENSEDKKIAVIVYCKFGKEIDYVYPQVSKVISNGEWTLVAGEIAFKDTAGCTANEDAYFRIQAGKPGDDIDTATWDIWFDGMTLNKKNDDGTYGKNIFVNGDCSVSDLETWAKGLTSCKVTFKGNNEQNPTGVIITAKEETDKNFILTNEGIVTNKDIKDGKITKKFTVINQGQEPVKVEFSLQCLHKDEANQDMWSSSEKATLALIEPGKQQTLTYTMSVNKDGKITVTDGGNTADYTPEEFFGRFNILQADGTEVIAKGTKIVILNDNPDLTFDTFAKDAVTIEVTYSKQFATSDMIPFTAFAILPLMVAFVLVIKKRKEN